MCLIILTCLQSALRDGESDSGAKYASSFERVVETTAWPQ